MNPLRWLSKSKNLLHRRQANLQNKHKPLLEKLEDRLAPATVSELGTTLTIKLNNDSESISVVSRVGSYDLSSTHGFIDEGISSGRMSFSGSSATVTSSGLAAYDTIRIVDSTVQDTKVRFIDS